MKFKTSYIFYLLIAVAFLSQGNKVSGYVDAQNTVKSEQASASDSIRETRTMARQKSREAENALRIAKSGCLPVEGTDGQSVTLFKNTEFVTDTGNELADGVDIPICTSGEVGLATDGKITDVFIVSPELLPEYTEVYRQLQANNYK